jgi:hypothetical protein
MPATVEPLESRTLFSVSAIPQADLAKLVADTRSLRATAIQCAKTTSAIGATLRREIAALKHTSADKTLLLRLRTESRACSKMVASDINQAFDTGAMFFLQLVRDARLIGSDQRQVTDFDQFKSFESGLTNHLASDAASCVTQIGADLDAVAAANPDALSVGAETSSGKAQTASCSQALQSETATVIADFTTVMRDILSATGAIQFLPSPVQEPIALTGFNQDVIVEASATDPSLATTVPFDGSGKGGNNVWYEEGFGGPSAGNTGLPPSGSTFTSLANPQVSFTMQPYTASNVAYMPAAHSTVTLSLSSPGSFRSLNFLAAAAFGAANITATLNFADGSTTSTTLSVPDWFNGANAAWLTAGRIQRSTGASISFSPTNPRLYEFDYLLNPADTFKVLNSVTFLENAGNESGVFAISGAQWS